MEFLIINKLLLSKKILQKSALWPVLSDIPPEDMMYHRDWCPPELAFFVVKLKVVCLAVEKSGQFYLLGDIYNRIVFLKKSSGYDVVVKRKCYDRYPSETEHYWYSQYFCQSKTFHVHLLFFQKYIWSIKKNIIVIWGLQSIF